MDYKTINTKCHKRMMEILLLFPVGEGPGGHLGQKIGQGASLFSRMQAMDDKFLIIIVVISYCVI